MDIRAIKGEEVGNMQAAIEDYTTRVEAELQKIKSYDLSGNDGIYGSAQIATIKTYLEETATQINSIVRHFDEFKEALVEVNAAYESKQESIKTNEVESAPADAGDLINVNRME